MRAVDLDLDVFYSRRIRQDKNRSQSQVGDCAFALFPPGSRGCFMTQPGSSRSSETISAKTLN